MCAVNGDCQSLACQGGACVLATCLDGMKDGTETDIDCGGGACAKCPSGHACLADTDCQSASCNQATLTCN
jgi:hypothetical protein